MKKFAIIISILIFTLTAFADQAAYVARNDSLHALALLKNAKQIKHFCNPCDDQSVKLENIETVEAVSANYEDYWELKINGTGVDLAYVYYVDYTGKWRNVADRLNIKVSDVPKYLPDEIR